MVETDEELVELLLIPGIGRAKAKQLYSYGFRTLKDIKEAKHREVAELPGIGMKLASRIKNYADLFAEEEEMEGEDATQIFLCPECGSLLSEDAEVCPACGAEFELVREDLPEPELDEELMQIEGMLVEKEDEESDSHWFKGKAELFICPNCGAFISADANHCRKCGVVFEDEDEVESDEETEELKKMLVDKDDEQDKAELFLCPNCSAFISRDGSKCNKCGLVFEGEDVFGLDEETEALKGMLVEKDPDIDGHWYKKKTELFLCPNCGAFISSETTVCAKCGVTFDGEEEFDTFIKDSDDQCSNCGTIKQPDAQKCHKCGFEHDIEKVLEEVEISKSDDTQLANLVQLLTGGISEDIETDQDLLDGHWYTKEAELYLCPNCGVFISGDATLCFTCGAIFEGEEDLETLPDEGETEDIKVTIDKLLKRSGEPVEEDETETTICPNCSLEKPVGEPKCSECGFEFEIEELLEEVNITKGDDTELAYLVKLLTDGKSEDIKADQELIDGHWYTKEAELFLCPSCGVFISQDASKCISCGAVFEGEEPLEDMPKVEKVDEIIDVVDHLFKTAEREVRLDEEHREEDGLLLAEDQIECPVCGATVRDSADECPVCGTDITEELKDLETDELILDLDLLEKEEILEDVPREVLDLEMDLEIPAEPEKEEKIGISKDFLSRWKTSDDDIPVKEKSVAKDFIKRWKRTKTDLDTIEESLDREEPEVDSRLIKLNKAIENNARDHKLWVKKAKLLKELEMFDEAIAAYDRAAELDVENEQEYKRNILEILYGGKLPAAEDELDEIDELELKQVVPDEEEKAEKRIEEIDDLLRYFPEQEELLMEKGQLLDSLGRHEEALGFYDKVIKLSYEKIKTPEASRVIGEDGSLRIGLVNGHGRVNGRVNGLLFARGKVNGRINGLVNGKVNGRTNGLVNGRINGLVNGRAPGLINGRGLVNGRINGLVNGRAPGLINGRGLVNGKVNGLVNGKVTQFFTSRGLINGLGLINGDGLVNGRGRFYKPSVRYYAGSGWHGKMAIIAVLISLFLLIPMLSNLVTESQSYAITIDGDFADWQRMDVHYDSPLDQLENEDLNILESRLSFRDPYFNIYLKVEGTMLRGRSSPTIQGMDSVFAFVDLDADISTGYIISNIGADMVLDVQGWDNYINKATVMRFDDTKSHDDWVGFYNWESPNVAIEGNEFEARIEIDNSINIDQAPLVQIFTQDTFGKIDSTDSLLAPMVGTLKVDLFEDEGGDTVAPGYNDVEIIQMTAIARPAEVSSIDFMCLGTADATYMTNIRMFEDIDFDGTLNTVIDTELAFTQSNTDNRNFTLEFTEPLVIGLNETINTFFSFVNAQNSEGLSLGLKLTEVNVSMTSVVDLDTSTGTVHNIGTPTDIDIDGAFGDWEHVKSNVDAANDVYRGTSQVNQSLINHNVDLRDYRMHVDDSLSLYTSVAGVMLGGVDIPTIRHRPELPLPDNTSDALVDSDRDGVPNIHDGPNESMAFDFDNDGVPDSQENGDVDGDGIIDIDKGGTDRWLNTTIPPDFPLEYANRFISRQISLPRVLEMKGIDYLSAFIDSDNNISTGFYVNGLVGADHMILTTGRGNVITSSELFLYAPLLGEIPWLFLGNVSTALDTYRLEMGLPLIDLGLTVDDEFTVSISMSDWQHSEDSTDLVMDHDISILGTRAPPPPVPDVSITKTANTNNAGPGDYITYTITLKNKKKAETSAYVWVNDTLPNGVTYISDTSGQSPSVNGNTYGYVFTNLAGGGQISFTITVQVNDQAQDGTDLINNANTDFTDSSGAYYGSASDTAAVGCKRPIISVEKVANTTQSWAGGLITYTIYYNNTGSADTGDVWINDTLPANTTYQSSSDAYDSVNGNTYTWHFTNIRKNTVNALTVTVSVDAGAPLGTITNWAALDYFTDSGYQLPSSSDSVSVTIIPIPELSGLIIPILGILGLIVIQRRQLIKR